MPNRPPRRAVLIALCIWLVALLFGGAALGAPIYEFALVQSTGSFADLRPPAINNVGSVAFYGASEASEAAWGFYLASPGSSAIQITIDPPGTTARHPSLSDEGVVLYRRTIPNQVESLTAATASGSTALYDSTGTIQQLSAFPQINDEGVVAFLGAVDGFGDGVFAGSGGPLTPIALASADLSMFGDPAVNNTGAVAFAACTSLGCQTDPGAQGIFVGSGASISPMLPVPEDFNFIAQLPAMNDSGVVAFYGSLASSGQQGIFTTDGSSVSTVALNDGVLVPDSISFAINADGLVVFRGYFEGGGTGLYLGPDPIADKIIASGDLLLGSEVSGLEFWREGLNDAGEVAFVARFADGGSAIVVARPVPESPLPMAAAVALLALALERLGQRSSV